MRIYCCGCEDMTDARLTDGLEIYPHRWDLGSLPFWKCDDCGNFVGCHHKTPKPTTPLGCIPTPEIKRERQRIHAILDPLWKSGRYKRASLYKRISETIGKQYHTAEIRTLDEAREIYQLVRSF